MAPPDDLTCHLDRRWRTLFSNKDADAIRGIQDRHACCGLHSVQDMAWPFPDGTHAATACREAFGRTRSCFGSWRQDEQVTGGLMLLVAVGGGVLKVGSFFSFSFSGFGVCVCVCVWASGSWGGWVC